MRRRLDAPPGTMELLVVIILVIELLNIFLGK
jgi:hypothetical protein